MNGTVITKKGLMLITKLLASAGELTFTRVAVGTGSAPPEGDIPGLDDLISYKMDGVIAEIKAEPEHNQASIRFQVNSINVEESFVVTEAGVYAQDPDDGEILYAYLDMSDDPQMVYDSESAISKFLEMTLVVVVGTVEQITAVINPQSLVSREDFDQKISSLQEGKVNIVVTDTEIPVESREKNTFYLTVKKSGTIIPGSGVIMASPYVGYKIIKEGE